jgi:glycosyltransferase involved in cell wall biosynthesis
MRVCLLSPGIATPAAAAVERLAAVLAADHEVEVVEPRPEVAGLVFAGPEHARSAAALGAIRDRYGSDGPDYLEVCDDSPLAFAALQARACGDPLLQGTAVGVRVAPSGELRALHNQTLSQPENTLVAALERYQLRHADHLIWPGGDCLDLYRRYYGQLGIELPAPLRCRPAAAPAPPAPGPERPLGEPLRILCLGELERSRGVLDLVEACLSLAGDGWELTLAGADTRTATMGQSVAETIEVMAGEDPRVRLAGPIAEAGESADPSAFDLLAVPARVEAWSEEVLVAMRSGLPVLATPVGGLVEQVIPGVTGWLADGTGPEPLRRALDALLAGRETAEPIAGGAIAAHLRALTDPEPILAAYGELASRLPSRPASARVDVTGRPLVTGIVPYYGASRFVTDAVDSLLGQTHPELEVIVVNDGSFTPADEVLEELAERPRVTVVTQANAGESSARNLAAILARGEYLVMLDADNMLEPAFVERALAAFECDPDLAYVSCWLQMVDENGVSFDPPYGYAPLGNEVVEDDARNWDGDTIAMLPRRLFTEDGYHYGPEGSMHSDWELYRWLRQERRFGTIIPERLARYRVLEDSLLRGHSEQLQAYGWNESCDRNGQRRMRWIAGPLG